VTTAALGKRFKKTKRIREIKKNLNSTNWKERKSTPFAC
jgi:hypothetical protein